MKISDRKYRKWNDKCQHEMNNSGTRHCNLLLDEDTGQCSKGHGRLLHSCKTNCCIIWVGGNHNYCEGHRKHKVKSICKITEKIMRRYSSIMWGKLSKSMTFENPEHKKQYEDWRQKLIESTYSKEYLMKISKRD